MRFVFDAEAERSVGRLRLFGALVLAIMATVLMASGKATAGAWVVVVVAWLVAVGWLVAFSRMRVRVRRRGEHTLDLDAQTLRMSRGAVLTTLAWDDVLAVDVDEDRLVVQIALADGRSVDIPPVWRGPNSKRITIYELRDEIRRCADA